MYNSNPSCVQIFGRNSGYISPHYIEDLQCDKLLCRQAEANRRRWIERVGIVLSETELFGLRRVCIVDIRCEIL